MPAMSGLELQELMSLKEIDLPIVFVSGHGDIDMVVHALKHGACDFLQKPVDEVRLLNALDAAIEKDRQHRAEVREVRTLEERYDQGASFRMPAQKSQRGAYFGRALRHSHRTRKRGCWSCRTRPDE